MKACSLSAAERLFGRSEGKRLRKLFKTVAEIGARNRFPL
jgi:hypothetical protein